MTEHEINKKLRSAYAHATPDVLSAVLADCTESKGSVCTVSYTHLTLPTKIAV